jgi:signal transduction histidine kinase
MGDERGTRWAPGMVLVLLSAFVLLTGSRPVAFIAGLLGLLGVAHLVTRTERRRKRAEAALRDLLAREGAARAEAEAANRAKDDFFLSISHELRGPLNAILGWVQLLRTRKLDEANGLRALETIERNAKSQANLIKDMLDVSRIIGGKVHLDLCPVELATIIDEAADSVRPAADSRDIHVETELTPQGGTVTGDPARLQQVMENLFSNAIKFTPRGGQVVVRLGYDEKHATITMRDTGQGIRPDFLPYVFDRFRQANGTAARLGGLGLGLAIVHHLVELHGGTVSAESDGEGQGAKFTVTLPSSQVGDAGGTVPAPRARTHAAS